MTDIDTQRIEKIFNHYDELLITLNGAKLNVIKNNKTKYKSIQFDVAQIGEHITNLPLRIRQFIGTDESKQIVFIRNAIIHEYDSFEYKYLEDAIYKYIPIIIKQLKILKDKNYLFRFISSDILSNP